MDKIEKDWYTLKEEKKEEYEYLRMLNMEKEELEYFCKGDAIMEEYESEVKEVNENEEYKYFLTEEEDAEMCRRTELAFAEEKGINQGIKQNQREMIIALQDLLTPEQMAERFKLSIEEIKKIINS